MMDQTNKHNIYQVRRCFTALCFCLSNLHVTLSRTYVSQHPRALAVHTKIHFLDLEIPAPPRGQCGMWCPQQLTRCEPPPPAGTEGTAWGPKKGPQPFDVFDHFEKMFFDC